jgi:hypothetical protein
MVISHREKAGYKIAGSKRVASVSAGARPVEVSERSLIRNCV